MKRTLLCGLLAIAAPALHAVELSLIRGPLENMGVDADASGSVRSIFKCNYAKMWTNLRGLTPDGAYQLTVDGNIEADFVADSRGHVDAQGPPAHLASAPLALRARLLGHAPLAAAHVARDLAHDLPER